MQAVHRKYIRIETGIAIVLNAIVGALFVWILFGGKTQIGLWGDAGLAFDLLPTVFMITLMSTVALTILTRKRLRGGAVPPLTDRGPRLPRFVLLRALLLAAVATIAIVPLSVLALSLVWTAPWSFGAVLIFKIIYSAALGLIVTPVIVTAALRDGATPQGHGATSAVRS